MYGKTNTNSDKKERNEDNSADGLTSAFKNFRIARLKKVPSSYKKIVKKKAEGSNDIHQDPSKTMRTTLAIPPKKMVKLSWQTIVSGQYLKERATQQPNHKTTIKSNSAPTLTEPNPFSYPQQFLFNDNDENRDVKARRHTNNHNAIEKWSSNSTPQFTDWLNKLDESPRNKDSKMSPNLGDVTAKQYITPAGEAHLDTMQVTSMFSSMPQSADGNRRPKAQRPKAQKPEQKKLTFFWGIEDTSKLPQRPDPDKPTKRKKLRL